MSKNKQKTTPVGRLSMRHEGTWWVAYWAPLETMDGATEIGRVRIVLAHDPEVRALTLDYFKAMFAIAVKNNTGLVASWPDPPRSAPEHEKAGNA